MDITLARETKRLLHELIKTRVLTDEDLKKINMIFIDRIEKLESDINA